MFVITLNWFAFGKILNKSINSLNFYASFNGESSCTQCPTFSSTTNLNLPSICAIISSLSMRSFSARISYLGIRTERKLFVSPLNHSTEPKGSDSITFPVGLSRQQVRSPHILLLSLVVCLFYYLVGL